MLIASSSSSQSPVRVKSGKARNEHLTSAFHLITDVTAGTWEVRHKRPFPRLEVNRCCGRSELCQKPTCQTRFTSLANGRTTSRVHSMNNLAAGLSVRLFKVINPTGQGGIVRFTGKIFMDREALKNRNIEPGSIARKGPLASSARCMLGDPVVTPFGGNAIALARNIWPKMEPGRLPIGGKHQGSSLNSASSILRRRAHLLREPATTKVRS